VPERLGSGERLRSLATALSHRDLSMAAKKDAVIYQRQYDQRPQL
jgi:hypothetical protein